MSRKYSFFKSRIVSFFFEQNFSVLFCALPAIFAAHGCSITIDAQKIAFPAPDKSEKSLGIRARLEKDLSGNFRILDDSLVESSFRFDPDQNAFNLSKEEAQNYGKAAGCNFFILVKSETLRRATLAKPDFYIESYAAFYVVSAKTGRLIFWKLLSFKDSTAAESEKELFSSIGNLASEISANLNSAYNRETAENPPPEIEELPGENSPEARNFRAPVPYRRIKPEYTAIANSYGIAATIDASVELDDSGNVMHVEIIRWAGYGLDESVALAIRKMNWRAAERDGKTLPIRVLLRYNFKKIEHDDD